MKKKMLIVFSIVVLIFGFTSCGKDMSDSPYLGKWTATTAEYGGIELPVSDILDGDWIVELTEDGKCHMTLEGEETSGEWEENENGFTVEDEFEYVVDGDNATVDYDGVTICFERS